MEMPQIALQLGAIALVLALPPAAHAGKAHEHGVAKLDVAIEGSKLTVALQSPLDSLRLCTYRSSRESTGWPRKVLKLVKKSAHNDGGQIGRSGGAQGVGGFQPQGIVVSAEPWTLEPRNRS